MDLQRFMNAMGANIAGAGTDKIVIEGVKQLHGARYEPVPDRIVAGTYLVAAAITGGEIAIPGARGGDLAAVLDKLRCAGCQIDAQSEGIFLRAPEKLRAIEVRTQPYPGFPTDMQAQMMAMCCVAEGTSVIVENVFGNRFPGTPRNCVAWGRIFSFRIAWPWCAAAGLPARAWRREICAAAQRSRWPGFARRA